MIKKKSSIHIMNNKGYSFMELMMVLAIISIVAQIGFTAWLDSKRRAYDSTAVADTRNLIEAIVNDMVGAEDVLYSHEEDDGNRIGAYTKADEASFDFDNIGDDRQPSLFLSPGVHAYIVGGTDVLSTTTGLTNTFVTATLWHGGGTPWNTTSGFREFEAVVDEGAKEITFVGFTLK